MKNRLPIILSIILLSTILLYANCLSSELEIHHPEFHARAGMKIQVVVGDKGALVDLRATLSGAGVDKIITEKKSPLKETEVVMLDLRKLPKGDYTLRINLSDGRFAVRKWNKPFDGLSRVAIDENNSILVDGKPFFPVFPWMVAKDKDLLKFKDCINTLNGVGFIKSNYTIEGFRKVLDLAKDNDMMMIGPNRGDYWFKGENGTPYYKESGKRKKDTKADIAKIAQYIEATKDHPSLLFWNWKDEPELDNYKNCIRQTEVREWYLLNKALDPEHPVLLNTGGDKFQRPKNNWGYLHIKNYTYNYAFKDRQVLLADVITQDYYPVDKRGHKKYPGSFERLTVAMDEMVSMNQNLTPFGAFVQTCMIPRGEKKQGHEAPTAIELRLMCWLNIIHGARMIGWFHYFNPTPAENFIEMIRFKEQVTKLTPMICTAKYEGIVKKKEKDGGRVDILVNKTSSGVFIIAANLNKKSERVTFTLDFVPKTVTVFEEDRMIPFAATKFSDYFKPYEVHLYHIDRLN